MRRDLPAGTVTFLFAEHRRVIRDACTAEGGPEVDRQGDAFFFAFPSAEGAASVAAAMTEALRSGPIRVRIGLHTRAPLVTGTEERTSETTTTSPHAGRGRARADLHRLISP